MKTAKKYITLAALPVLSATLQAAEPAAKPVSKPNIVFVLLDDFGYESVTANGGESYQTPVMDRLAATGVRFEQCHVQPMCTPSRVELLTGFYNKRNYSCFAFMDPSQKTFGNLLKDAGYATCIAGKWQLGNGYEGPRHFGFDEYLLWHLFTKENRYSNPVLHSNGKPFDCPTNAYGPDVVSDYVLDFIQRKKDVPFAVYYPMMLPHGPFEATPDSLDYLGAQVGERKKPNHFADMIAYSDKLIGKLIAKLDELQLRDNTLVLILGDNGNPTGRTRFQGRDVAYGKAKTTVWGTHVPCIGNWPGHVASGKVCKDLIGAVDVLPTLCEAAGATVPAELKIDGRSFLPQLRGEKGNPREWLYAWYHPDGGAKARAEFAHDGTYKLYTNGRFFNVKEDDLEKSPLAAGTLDDTAKAAKLKLEAALKQFEGPRPEYFVKQAQKRNQAEDPVDNGSGRSDTNQPANKKEDRNKK